MAANANAAANGATSTRTRKPANAGMSELAKLKAELAETKAKLEAAEVAKTEAEAKAKKSGTGTYLDYATKAASPAIVQFMVWLNREFPAQFPTKDDATQLQIVNLAIKCYSRYQKSDINYKSTKAAK